MQRRVTLSAELGLHVPLDIERSAPIVIARQTARRLLRSAVLWGYVFGVTVASSAISYGRIYKTPVERQRLADTFGGEPCSECTLWARCASANGRRLHGLQGIDDHHDHRRNLGVAFEHAPAARR